MLATGGPFFSVEHDAIPLKVIRNRKQTLSQTNRQFLGSNYRMFGGEILLSKLSRHRSRDVVRICSITCSNVSCECQFTNPFKKGEERRG